MSNTNLTGTEINCSEVNPEDNKLRGKQSGEATKANKLGQTEIEQGIEALTIVIIPYMINNEGERVDSEGKKLPKSTRNSTEIQENYNRLKQFNKAKLEEKKKQSKKQHEDR